MAWKTWNIQDICGSRYTTNETLLGDILQTIYWADNYLAYGDIPFGYSNVKGCLQNDLRNSLRDLEPIVAEPYENDGDYSNSYCSVLTTKNWPREDWVRIWCTIFDYNLHDAAVTYTFKAAESEGEEAKQYAGIACQLWGYSRQLRRDVIQAQYQQSQREKWQLQADLKNEMSESERILKHFAQGNFK